MVQRPENNSRPATTVRRGAMAADPRRTIVVVRRAMAIVGRSKIAAARTMARANLKVPAANVARAEAPEEMLVARASVVQMVIGQPVRPDRKSG